MKVIVIMGRLLVAAGLVAALLIEPAAFGQKGKPTPGSIPLNVDFASGNSITGDDGGVYSDALQNVRAEIYYNQFYLDTNENKGDGERRVNLWVVGAGACPAPGVTTNIPCPAGGPQDVYTATKSGVDIGTLKYGESTQKRLAISWAEGAYSYHLRHNGEEDARHGSVTFRCTDPNAIDTTPCSQWSASPTTGTNGTVGLYANPTRGNVGEIYLGSLTMPFVMTMTKK